MSVLGSLEDNGLRLATDKAVLIDLVPGGRDDVDLIFVRQERGDGGGIVAHPELSFLRVGRLDQADACWRRSTRKGVASWKPQ